MPLWLSIAAGLFAAKLAEDTLVFGFRYNLYRRQRKQQRKLQHMAELAQNVTSINKKKGAKDGQVHPA